MNQSTKTSKLSTPSLKQQIFLKYLTWILVDLTVLNFFAEYWDRVTITSFGVSLFIAITLQVLLKMTISLKHRLSNYMKSNEKFDKKILHIFSTFFLLFAFKFVMLLILQLIFGDAIVFSGAYHGVVAFIVVVIGILAAEYLLTRLYKSLA
jgi:hypothetical protein